MKRYILLLTFAICSHIGYSQTDFIAVQDGDWEDGATWGNTSPGVEGTDFPGVDDDAYTNGFSIDITGTVDVNNLFIQFDVDNGINFNSSSRTCQIHGTLVGWDGDDGGNEEIPDTDIVDTDEQGRFRFIGDGAFFDGSDNIIFSWSTDATLFRVLVDLNSSSTTVEMEDADIQIASGGYFRVDDGILDIGSGNSITGTPSDSELRILSDGTLDMSINVSGFSELDIDASGSIITTGYINSTDCTIDGSLLTSFSGASQTQGWWQSTNSPSTISIGVGSTISFSASADQAIPSETYGNLTLSGSGTKNLVTQVAGTLVVQGDFIINSASVIFTSGITSEAQFQGDITNNGTWTTPATQDIRFNGSTTQQITGNAITFNDDVIIQNTMDIDASITIASGKSITDNNNNISFGGNTTFTGAYTAGSGTITYDGSLAQTISGTATITSLTLNNASGIINNGTINLEGTLTLATSSTTLDADGSGSGVFVITSDAGGTATVAELTGTNQISGNVTYERYFDGIGDVWRNYGVPVTGATISELQDDFTVSGSFTGANAGGANFYFYTESTSGNVDQGWVAYPSTTSSATLSSTRGYSFYTRSEDGLPATVDVTGTLNQGNIDFGVTYTDDAGQPATEDGWNLINNPYPATIDWDDADWTKTNVNGTVSVWDTSTGTYLTWNGTTGGLTNGLIASGQSFWIQTNASSPFLIAREGVKSTGGNFERTEGLSNHLIVSLIQEEKMDKAYIHFRSDATDDFDTQFDGVKLSNLNNYNLSSQAATGENLSINSMGSIAACNQLVKLSITEILEGNYDLMFEDLVSFTSGFDITLVDNFLGTSKVLSEGTTYNFEVTSDLASFGDARFELEFSAVTLETDLIMSAVNDCDQEFISVIIDNSQIGVSYNLINGTDIIASNTSNGGQVTLQISKTLLVEGTNTYEVNLDNGTCGSAAADNPVSFDFVGLSEVSSVEGGVNCGAGSVIISAAGAPANGFYRWYSSADASEAISGENASSFTTPELEVSKTYFAAIVNSAGCESKVRMPIHATINELPQTPEIITDGNLLISTSKTGNQWFKDNVLIDGAVANTYEVSESGSYSVIVENSSMCSAGSENIVMTITAIDTDRIDDSVLKIFPNPITNGQDLTISIKELSRYHTITLYDNQGKLMLTQKVGLSNTIKMDISLLNKGIYFMHMNGENDNAVHKILKK